MLWYSLLLPDLPLQVFTRGSDDEHTPFAVISAPPAARVVAANQAALAQGVQPGASRASALALIPGLLLRERDVVQETAALHEIAHCARRYTPQVSIAPPDAVLLEAGASLRLFGGVRSLAASLAADLAGLGFDTRVAAAPTPLAARWLAHSHPGGLLEKPSALAAVLDTLPLEVLVQGTEVDARSLELLAGIGLQTLGEVRRLPRAGLARRAAGQVMDALDRAAGLRPDPRAIFEPPEDYSARLVLPSACSDTDTLLFAARRLLAGLCIWLAARHAGIERFRLVLEYDDAPEHGLEIVLGATSRDEARFVLLLREHLARLELSAPVEALRLETEPPQVLEPACATLFDDPAAIAGDPGLLLATLQARLGRDAVHGLALHADHRPEKAWRASEPVPARTPSARPSFKSSSAAQVPAGSSAPAAGEHPPGLRPLWLVPQPRPLKSAFTLLAGPERIESGWWDGAEVRRDYYVARDAEG
ncbi:MAG: DNA polymerase Y family protein, partial [Zoogloea sp.]|nr:DNA polymerase Y family protein [Zoogloea sp.]